MTILLTGVAGFIGHHLAIKLLHDDDVTRLAAVDKCTYAVNPHHIERQRAFAHDHFARGDIADRAWLFSICEQFCPDIIISAIAESHVDNSILSD